MRVLVDKVGRARMLTRLGAVAVSAGALALGGTLMAPTPPAGAATTGSVPVYSFGPSAGGSIYLTIDDGSTPDERVLGLMASQHVPMASFVTVQAVQANVAFWQQFVRAGGLVGDHTVSHPVMSTLSLADQVAQWSTARAAFRSLLGVTPTLGRPPYGTIDQSVSASAAQAGLSGLVLWSATMSSDGLVTYDRGPLRSGEIVLLHWVPGLYGQLVSLLRIAAAGGLHPAPLPWTAASASAVAATATSTGDGYRLGASDGAVFPYGAAPWFGSMSTRPLAAPVTGMAVTPGGGGYWLVAADGGVFSFGDAAFAGSASGMTLVAPVVAMAATPDGRGYWLVAGDGGVFSFGDAAFLGSASDWPLASPVVAMAATPDGRGYWLVGAGGAVLPFGDAGFSGSMGGLRLAAPVTGMAITPDGRGYWLVASDGGVFAFGDAGYAGSMGGHPLDAPVTAMAPTHDGRGYWLVASDGGVFAFGDATFLGSRSGQVL